MERSLHSLRSCVPPVASEQSSSAVEMTEKETVEMTGRVGVDNDVEPYPRALIVGHHDLRSALPLGSSKNPPRDCPCFDAVKEYADLQP